MAPAAVYVYILEAHPKILGTAVPKTGNEMMTNLLLQVMLKAEQ